MIGRFVGNTYRIVGRLGEGGMGTVYRALDEALEREVAVKVVRPDLAREPEIAERFRLEARTLAKVHHPAIATIHSFLQEGDELFLILELVRGRTLSQALRDDGPFPWRQAVGLLAPALDGIEAAHRLGIVHRDLKPDNLMVTEDGRLKVMDFGIARAVGSSHLTRTGLLVGTLRYVAPEQIRGEEVDRRTDVYSLGIVLYEMLTGQVPFEGGNDYAILRAQIEDMPAPPGDHVPGLPAWLDRAVLQALAKDRADRFPTAEEMRSFLLAQGSPAADDPLDATLQLREERDRALPRAAAPRVPPPSQETSEIPGSAPSLPPVATGGGAATTRTSPPPPPPPPIPLAAPALPASPDPAPVSAPSSYHPVRLDRSGPKAGWLALAALIFLIVAGVGISLLLRRTDSDPVASDPTPDSATLASPPAEGDAPDASVSTSPAPAPAIEPESEPIATSPAPSRTPAPRTSAPRETPRPVFQEPEPAAPAPPETDPAPSSAPFQPAEVEETPPAGGTGEVPLDELRRLSGELSDGTARLFTAFQGYLEKKSDADQEITGDDEQLEEDLEALQSTAERFNGSFQNGMMSRLRRMGRSGTDIEQLRRKLAKLDERGNRVETLINRVQPGGEVQQEWQGVRRRWKRVGQILSER